jgi:hypothetical protein
VQFLGDDDTIHLGLVDPNGHSVPSFLLGSNVHSCNQIYVVNLILNTPPLGQLMPNCHVYIPSKT